MRTISCHRERSRRRSVAIWATDELMRTDCHAPVRPGLAMTAFLIFLPPAETHATERPFQAS